MCFRFSGLPLLLPILLLTFTVIQFVPGGPVDQMIQLLKGQAGGEAAATGWSTVATTLRTRRTGTPSRSWRPAR